MQHKNFVTAEEVSAEQKNIQTMVRFASTLTLLRRVLIPTLLVMLFAAATPPYFLWFVGELVECYGEAACSVTHDVLGWQVVLSPT